MQSPEVRLPNLQTKTFVTERVLSLSDWSIRCSRKSSPWSLPVLTASTSASSPTDRRARERRTPWRSVERNGPLLLLASPRPVQHSACVCACFSLGVWRVCGVQGVADDPGINQRALRLLFSEVTEKAPDWEYNITVSMVEIYNETLR